MSLISIEFAVNAITYGNAHTEIILTYLIPRKRKKNCIITYISWHCVPVKIELGARVFFVNFLKMAGICRKMLGCETSYLSVGIYVRL